MLKILSLSGAIAIFTLSPSALALNTKSAHRGRNESYLSYKFEASTFALDSTGGLQPKSAADSAVAYGGANLPAVTVWENEAVLNERFQKIRDTRFLETQDRPGFMRRSSWLYPDDGCYARAGLAILNLTRWHDPIPSKIFVFGNLEVKTANAQGGSVAWWYHVVPVVEVAGEKYALDPALEPARPLKLAEWLARMNPDINSLEVAICGSGTYTPYDDCARMSDGVESSSVIDQPGFLDAEWQRLLDLSRDPAQELGDSPPWLSPVPIMSKAM